MKREISTTVYVAILVMLSAVCPLAGQALSLFVDQTSVTEATNSIKAVVTRPGDPNESLTTSFEYDGNGNVVARIDGNGNRTQYAYDKVNRLMSIDYPGGDEPEVRFTYDRTGRFLCVGEALVQEG